MLKFLRGAIDTPAPQGFKGYISFPTVLAFARKISNSSDFTPIDEEGKSMKPNYFRRRR